MADSCTLPKMSGRSICSNQGFAFFEVVPSATITVAIIATFGTLRTLFISKARSWYLSIFSSSVVVIFWSADTAMFISVHSCLSLCTAVISDQLCFSCLCVCRWSCPTFPSWGVRTPQMACGCRFVSFTSKWRYCLFSLLPRVISHKASLIDNIFINEPFNQSISGLSLNDISDHLPIFAVISGCEKAFDRNKYFTFRSKIS